MADDITTKLIFQQAARQQAEEQKAVTETSAFEGIGKSLAYSAPRLVGYEPDDPVQQKWEAQNPGQSAVAGFVGTLIPYLGYAKGVSAISKVPRVQKALNLGEGFTSTLQKGGALAGATREVARWTPFELGRVGVASILAPENAGDIAKEAAINLALEGGVGGVLGGLGKLSKDINKTKYERFYPSVNEFTDSPQVSISKLKSFKQKAANLDEVELARLDRAIKLNKEDVWLEMPLDYKKVRRGKTGDYVESPGKFVSTIEGNEYKTRMTNGLFSGEFPRARNPETGAVLKKQPERPNINIKQLVEGDGKNFFSSKEQVEAHKKMLAFGEDVEEFVKFPRIIETKGRKLGQDKLLESTLSDFMTKVDDNLYIAREMDGAFVFAKKLYTKPIPKTKASQATWGTWKTSRPELWAKELTTAEQINLKAADNLLDDVSLRSMEVRPDNPELFNYGIKLKEDVPIGFFYDLKTKGKKAVGEYAEKFAKATGLENAVGDGKAAIQTLKNFTKDYLSPSMFQFLDSPIAAYIFKNTEATYAHATAMGTRYLYGIPKLSGKNIAKNLLSPTKLAIEENGLINLIDNLKLDVDDVNKIYRAGDLGLTPAEAIEQLGLSDRAQRYLFHHDIVTDLIEGSIQKSETIAENINFKAKPYHRMMTRTWEDGTKIGIYNKAGQLVELVGAGSEKTTVKLADEIVETMKKEGFDLRRDNKVFKFDSTESVLWDSKLAKKTKEYSTIQMLQQRNPSQFKKRKGIKGYKDTFESVKDFKDYLTKQVNARMEYLAKVTSQKLNEKELFLLKREDLKSYDRLAARLSQFAGEQTPAGKWQNEVTDRLLSGIVGDNSASKIVTAMNKGLYHLSFGFFNTQFPTLQALTFVNTVLPESAFVLNTPVGRKAQYYGHYLAMMGDSIKSVSKIEPLKLFKASLDEMFGIAQSDELFKGHVRRAAQEGIVDPAFVEEVAGATAKRALEFRNTLNKDGFAKWLIDASNFLNVSAEKISRLQAFTNGRIIGRDFFNMEGERLYQFATDFTNKTMFQYASVNRARFMTSPLGSAFGLFKNWSLHYLYTMLKYSGDLTGKNTGSLMWALGGTATAGGIGALPLYSIADAFVEGVGDQTIMEYVYEGLGDNVGSDALQFGLPAMLGISLQGSASVPGSDIVHDSEMLGSFPYMTRGKAVGAMLGDAINHWEATGEHPAKNERVFNQFLKAFAPKTFYRAAQAIGNDSINSLSTNLPVQKNVPLWQRVAYTTGFNTVDLDKIYQQSDTLYQRAEKRKNAIKKMGQALSEAWLDKDEERVRFVIQRSVSLGLPVQNIVASAKSRHKQTRTDILERNKDKVEVYKSKKILGLD